MNIDDFLNNINRIQFISTEEYHAMVVDGVTKYKRLKLSFLRKRIQDIESRINRIKTQSEASR